MKKPDLGNFADHTGERRAVLSAELRELDARIHLLEAGMGSIVARAKALFTAGDELDRLYKKRVSLLEDARRFGFSSANLRHDPSDRTVH